MKTRLCNVIFAGFAIISLFTALIYPDEKLDAIVANLEKLRADYPQEKVHLHLDKPYYSVGDDVWFQAYVVNAEHNELSDLSKVLHVDIVDGTDSVRQSLVLPVVNGLSQGNINLADSLFTAGNYHIRAYTKWMQNFDEEYFYNKQITIGDAFNSPLLASADIKTIKDNDKQSLAATINYKTLDSVVMAGNEVSYSVMYRGRVLAAGKAFTNADGKVAINTPLQKDMAAAEVMINTRIRTVSGSTPRSFRAVNSVAVGDVSFFPEGGTLVNGLRSKLGFKAVGTNGLGMEVNGYITDQEGNKLMDITGSHAGMGVIALQPVAGKSYTAVITTPGAGAKRYLLPVAQNSGYVLSINHLTGDSLAIKVAASADLAGGNEVVLVAQSNANIQYVTRLKVDQQAITTILPANKFGRGMVQFTLFNTAYQPLAERLVFVMLKNLLNARIATDKPEYTKRQKVNLDIAITQPNGKPAQGAFSVAVIDAGKITQDEDNESTILSNLLLTSDLKGYVEAPNYYFNNHTREKQLQLDALMLTQGWRRFTWADIQAGKYPALNYKPESGLHVAGVIKTLGGKPIPNGKVKLFSATAYGPVLLDTTADANGHFVFDQLDFVDSTKFVVRAKSDKDRNNVKIELDEVKSPIFRNYATPAYDGLTTASMVQYLKNTDKRFNALILGGMLDRTNQLKEVKIRDRRPPKIYKSAVPDVVVPDFTLTPDKLQSAGNLTTLLGGLNGVIIKRNKIYGRRQGKEGRMLIMLDGNPIDDIAGVSPTALAGVQIIKGGNMSGSLASLAGFSQGPALPGDEPMNPEMGIIYLTTERRATKYNTPQINGVAHLKPRGYAISREFYSPAYDAQPDQKMADLRSTIYWKSNIITGADGKADLSFFTADEPGMYKLVIEGLDVNGNLIRKVSGITVR